MSSKFRVREVKWHSDGVFELQLEHDGLAFTPGDCLALYGEDDSTSRPYSMAGGSGEDVLRFVIRVMEDGVVSSWLSTRKPGDLVKVSPPFGWFRPGSNNGTSKSVFMATGTGIAPFLAYFRTYSEGPKIDCYYGVRELVDAVDHEFIASQANLTLAVSREKAEEKATGVHHGRLTDLLTHLDTEADTHYYLCGLDAMIDEVTEYLEENGVDITQIHRECFFNASY